MKDINHDSNMIPIEIVEDMDIAYNKELKEFHKELWKNFFVGVAVIAIGIVIAIATK